MAGGARVLMAAVLGLTFWPTALAARLASLAAVGHGPVGRVPLGLDAYMPVPDDSPLTAARVALGRQLFFDTRLSADGSMSCASCHDPAHAFTDGRATSVGIFGRRGARAVPAIINRGYGRSFFWDGRATSLEQQVLQPIDNPNELDAGTEAVVSRLRGVGVYAAGFVGAFGCPINRDDLARALSSYVRSILAGGSRVDAYLTGDAGALSETERAGLQLFRGKANCVACHVGPLFTDERFHNTGIAWRGGSLGDEGRAAVTGRPEDRGAFKTPTLRQIAETAPYMHDGSVATLGEAIDFYDGGGMPNPGLDPELRPLHLTGAEKLALEAFLRALTGPIQEGGQRGVAAAR
jgi:cytochrome c peroxidase